MRCGTVRAWNAPGLDWIGPAQPASATIVETAASTKRVRGRTTSSVSMTRAPRARVPGGDRRVVPQNDRPARALSSGAGRCASGSVAGHGVMDSVIEVLPAHLGVGFHRRRLRMVGTLEDRYESRVLAAVFHDHRAGLPVVLG